MLLQILYCSPGCRGFVCVPLSNLGGPCTASKDCKSGMCGASVGALWCVQCTRDADCGDGSFCERNPFQPDGRSFLTCYTRQDNGAYCDRTQVCASGRCLGPPGSTKCGNCTRDGECAPGTWCDLNPSRKERNSCRGGMPDGAPCNRDGVCG